MEVNQPTQFSRTAEEEEEEEEWMILDEGYLPQQVS